MTGGQLLAAAPHRRLNPLTGEWVLVSPQRTQRPWLGHEEDAALAAPATYDPECYLCPGNARAGGVCNPAYEGTFAFENDFPALLPTLPSSQAAGEHDTELLRAEAATGTCRVICFTPRHDLHIGSMEPAAVRQVVDVWSDQTAELAADPSIAHVQIFENRGASMGASNPHPHCQVWADGLLPVEPAKELARQSAYRDRGERCLLCDYLALELADGSRLVAESEHFVVVVPFWAVWPYEVLVMPRAHHGALPQLSDVERSALAATIQDVVRRYDRLFATPFPYSMGIHQQPADGPHPEWHLHAHYYPPLLRSAAVRKFMVGYEMLAQPQRDLTAESAAERLRGLAVGGKG